MGPVYKLLIGPNDGGGAILGFHKGQYVYCTKVTNGGHYPLEIVPVDPTLLERGYVDPSVVQLLVADIFEQL